MINKHRKSIYPEYKHIQLLKACILEGESAIEAWQNWDRITNINDIDNASMRLLPSLYLTLKENNIHPDYFNKIKGVYRRTLVKNKLLLVAANEVVERFQTAGIDILFLKGVSLILQGYYKDPAQRPMSDIDILIKPNNSSKAKTIMKDLNWQKVFINNIYSNPLLAGINYYKKPNMEIDLHWYLMHLGLDYNLDSILWEAAKTISYNESNVFVLNPSYQLMHICLHGVTWSGTFPLRWILDAMLLINSGIKINWQDILNQTERRHMTIPMLTALNILKNIFDIYVPNEILQQLNISGSKTEIIWYGFAKRKPIPIFGMFIINYFYYKLFYKDKFTFPGWFRYMQHIYNADSLIGLPWTLIKKIVYTLKNDLRNKF